MVLCLPTLGRFIPHFAEVALMATRFLPRAQSNQKVFKMNILLTNNNMTICRSTWLKFKRNNRKAMNMFYWNTTKKNRIYQPRNPLHCCYHLCCRKTMMKFGVSHGPYCVSCIIDMTHFKHIHDELSQLDKMIADVIHFPVFPTQHQ